ncbi:MAG: transglutaminase domain-containing protein [Planctomycetota bacterium]
MNNVVEIGNDIPGDQHFYIGTRHAPEWPVNGDTESFFNEYFNGHEWVACGNETRANVSIPTTTVLVIEVEFEQAGVTASPDGDYYIIDRPDFIPNGLTIHPDYMRQVTGYSTPRPRSLSFHDVQKDWDFLIRKKDEILALEGVSVLDEFFRIMINAQFEGFKKLTNASPAFQKAQKMADYCALRRHIGQYHRNPAVTHLDLTSYLFKSPKSNHFADVLNGHSHNCGGAAGAFQALCAAMGIPVRAVTTAKSSRSSNYARVSGHAIAEVYLNERWMFVENTNSTIRNSHHGRPLFPVHYQDIVARPETRFKEPQWTYVELSNGGGAHGKSNYARAYGAFNALQFAGLPPSHSSGGTNSVAFFPSNSTLALGAQYPGERLIFKVPNKISTSPDFAVRHLPPVIHLTPMNDIWKDPVELKISQGEAVRKRFYLPKLTGVRAVRANILFNTAGNTSDAGGWYVKINGKRYAVGDPTIGGWTAKTGFAEGIDRESLNNYVSFDLPMEDLIQDTTRDTPAKVLAEKNITE